VKGKKGTKLYQWQEKGKLRGICGKCGKEFNSLSVEHIIPQYILQQLGLVEEVYEDEENFDLYCLGCNRFKGGRIDMAHPKTVTLLKKYVNKLN
jgi:hypothetical protein